MDLVNEKIPKRLHPDNLTDVVVTISYRADYSRQYLEKELLGKLEDFEPLKGLVEIKMPQNEIAKYGTEHYYANANYRLMIGEYNIHLNIVGAYPGWVEYSRTLIKILNPIYDQMFFTGVELRYISKHPEVSIFEKLDGIIKLNHLEIFPGSHFVFYCKHNGDDEYFVETRLTDRQATKDNVHISIVDIKLKAVIESGSYKDTLKRLGSMHDGEKTMYYTLLDKHFVESMNPEY